MAVPIFRGAIHMYLVSCIRQHVYFALPPVARPCLYTFNIKYLGNIHCFSSFSRIKPKTISGGNCSIIEALNVKKGANLIDGTIPSARASYGDLVACPQRTNFLVGFSAVANGCPPMRGSIHDQGTIQVLWLKETRRYRYNFNLPVPVQLLVPIPIALKPEPPRSVFLHRI